MKKIHLCLLTLLLFMGDAVSFNLKAQASGVTRSLPELQQQFVDLKFGMFIHFNIPTFAGEDWPEPEMEAATFYPAKLDCEQWAEVAQSAKMRYGYLTKAHIEMVKAQLTELLTNYGEITALIIDGWDAPWSRISYEQNAGQHISKDSNQLPALSCLPINRSWFWKPSFPASPVKDPVQIVKDNPLFPSSEYMMSSRPGHACYNGLHIFHCQAFALNFVFEEYLLADCFHFLL